MRLLDGILPGLNDTCHYRLRLTLHRWYLALAGVLIVWLGVAEAVALPAYGGYAREVFANLLAGVPADGA